MTAPIAPAVERTAVGRQAAVLLAAYGAVAIWGATPLATKVAVAGLDPLAVGLLRTLLAGIVALPLILLGRIKAPRSGPARVHLAVSALGGFVIFPLLFSYGIQLTTAGHGALLLGILPVLTGLIAALLERRLPSARWWWGCAIAIGGTALLVGARFDLSLADGSLRGDLLVLASAVAASAGYVTGARAAREIGTWAVTLWGLVLGSLVWLPVLPFVFGEGEAAAAGALAWSAVLFMALLSSILGYGAWYWALGQGGIGRTGLAQFAQPLVGVALAVALLGEAMTWPMAAAAGAILAGVALARGRA
ncbi:MAG: DMT family transporter [Alphaproteobacteria bacterium]|nr:DMT family transporter [Alphaproteobacteria bacterium]